VSAPRRVALTFDAEHADRPATPGVDERLIETLAATGIRATFFIQGRWAEAWPKLAHRIAADGHLIGSHSHYHARVPLFSDAGLAEDIRTAETAIREASGVDPRPWFRCPFGTGMDDPRILAGLEAAGYRHVGWNVVGDDWDPSRTAAQVEESVVSGALRYGDGAVILLHSWPDQMIAALPGIVARLAQAGASFVRIDALEQLPASGESVDELAEGGARVGSMGTA
jgi:peptidoglycan/xylan/chitin deacetylase (PgdA/CDA1 family)